MSENNSTKTDPPQAMTYRSAGVDIAAGNELARRIGRITKSTHRKEVISGIGGFAGFFFRGKRNCFYTERLSFT